MITRKLVRQFIICSVAATQCSCGGDNNESDLTSGRFPDTVTPEELIDSSPRYIDSSHNLRYSDGGIMMQECHGETGDTISLTDIDCGSEIKLCWKGALTKGVADNATIELDGIPLNESEIYIEKINTKGVWITIRTPYDDNGLLVVNRQ